METLDRFLIIKIYISYIITSYIAATVYISNGLRHYTGECLAPP